MNRIPILILILLLIGCPAPPEPEQVFEIKVYRTNLFSFTMDIGNNKIGETLEATIISKKSYASGFLNTKFTVIDLDGNAHMFMGRYRITAKQIDTIYYNDPRHSEYKYEQ